MMSRTHASATALAAILAIAGALGGPLATPALAKEKLTGEQQLAKTLEGRVAGKPVSCISVSQSNDTQIIDKTAIVYRVGSTLYVNRPNNAENLDSDDILVTKLYSSQLCRLDTVQLHDRTGSHMWRGFVSLQDFVPYTRDKQASAAD